MKQTTIFDYFLNLPKQTEKKRYSAPQKIEESLQNKNGLIKTYVQRNLSQLIKEQEEIQKVKDLLGTSWHRQKNGFGFTDKDNIMIVSTIHGFNSNFFNVYKFEDFIHIIDLSLKMEDLKEDKSIFIKINEIEYNSYYLSKAFQILGDQIKGFQHKMLKLLYIKNSKFATLICPKF
jgi:hypothetical protein